MRPIHTAKLDKTRPVLILTRELVRPHLTRVTVAPITSTVRACPPIPKATLGHQIGFLFPQQEEALTTAIRTAFDLD